MTEQDDFDQISRGLGAIFADFYTPPSELDLRGVAPATFALGLCYGFDSWEDVHVVANSRRSVATATEHWAEHHPSLEFLGHVAGTGERAHGHRQLLDRAHPDCQRCQEVLDLLAAPQPDSVSPDAPPDAVDLAWLKFQYAEATRSGEVTEVTGPLYIPGRSSEEAISARRLGDRDWHVTVRHPGARRATVWIEWDDGAITKHLVAFPNDLARIDAEPPRPGARPDRVRVQITDPPRPGPIG